MEDIKDGERVPLIPIVVGIVADTDTNEMQSSVRSSLRDVFDRLDREHPASPKVLLSTLKDEADRGAIEQALQRPGWNVVVASPLELSVYEQRFSDEIRNWLDTLKRDSRVQMLELHPLLDPLTSNSYEIAEVFNSISEHDENPIVEAHYQQAKLFVAGDCQLLVAVGSFSNEKDSPTFVDSVVRYALGGALDQQIRDIVENSVDLRSLPLLDMGPTCAVWQLHPESSGRMRLETVSTGADPLVASTLRLEGVERVARGMPLVERLDAYNRRARRSTRQTALHSVELARQHVSANGLLDVFSDGMSKVQERAIRLLRLSVWTLAILFACAALSFEMYGLRGDFSIGRWAIASYAGFAFLACGVYLFARYRRWQPLAEEYRGVIEALRVQRAWWDSGLIGPEYCVDRFYLQGAQGSLALVRAAVHALITTAVLLKSPLLTDHGGHQEWVKSQIEYFERRIEARKAAILNVEVASWFLFAASLGGALLLVSAQIAAEKHWSFVSGMFESKYYPHGLPFAIVVIFVLAPTFWICRHYPHSIVTVFARRTPVLRIRGWVGAILVGILFSLSLFDLAGLSRPWADKGMQLDQAGLGRDMAAACASIAITIAATLRYVSDKLLWEADIHSYREALGFFERALVELQGINESPSGASQKESERRQIILELGKKALNENERWLRAHRSRPLEPVV